MNSKREPAEMLGVDRSRTFAQAQAIAKDLCAPIPGGIDESAGHLETEEAALQLGLCAQRFDRARTATDEAAEYGGGARRADRDVGRCRCGVSRNRQSRGGGHFFRHLMGVNALGLIESTAVAGAGCG